MIKSKLFHDILLDYKLVKDYRVVLWESSQSYNLCDISKIEFSIL